jgi:hypothetical protein
MVFIDAGCTVHSIASCWSMGNLVNLGTLTNYGYIWVVNIMNENSFDNHGVIGINEGGTLTNFGTFSETGYEIVDIGEWGGYISLNNGSRIYNYGTFTAVDGGILYCDASFNTVVNNNTMTFTDSWMSLTGTATNNGTINLYSGSTVTIVGGCNFQNTTSGTVYGDGTDYVYCDNYSAIANSGSMSGGTLEFVSASSQQPGAGIYNYVNFIVDGP